MRGGGARFVRRRTVWGPRIRTDAVGVATISAALVLMAACVDVSGPRNSRRQWRSLVELACSRNSDMQRGSLRRCGGDGSGSPYPGPRGERHA